MSVATAQFLLPIVTLSGKEIEFFCLRTNTENDQYITKRRLLVHNFLFSSNDIIIENNWGIIISTAIIEQRKKKKRRCSSFIYLFTFFLNYFYASVSILSGQISTTCEVIKRNIPGATEQRLPLDTATLSSNGIFFNNIRFFCFLKNMEYFYLWLFENNSR